MSGLTDQGVANEVIWREVQMVGCQKLDTDNDGIANSCDLDSDGDGCSDAFEAGATTNATPNYAFTGAVGANGLINTLENNDTPTATTNYTSTYLSAGLDVSSKLCADKDGDSVPDIFDIDDDNDGVLDALETPPVEIPLSTYSVNPNSKYLEPVTVNTNFQNGPNNTFGGVGTQVNSGVNLVTYGLYNSNFKNNSYSFSEPVENVKFCFYDIDNTGTLGEYMRLKVFNNGVPYVITPSDITFKGSAIVDLGGNTYTANSTSGTFDIDNIRSICFKLKGPLDSLVISCRETYGTQSLGRNFAWSTPVFDAKLDTDNDGIPNACDLDSDGDGCSDAFESGATTDATANFKFTSAVGNNGLANSIENNDTQTAATNYTSTYSKALDNTIKTCCIPPANPTNPTASPSTICTGQSSTLSATCATGTLSWYSDAALTTAVTSPVSPVATTTYYAACVDGTCKSPSANVVVTVEPIPAIPTNATASPASICIGQSSVLSATCVSPAVATWYTNVGLTTPLVSTTVSPTSTTTYYVTCKNTTLGCESTASTVTVTVNPLPAAPSTATSNVSTICGTGSVTLSAVCAAGTVPYWYSDAAGTSAPLAIGTTNTGSIILAISTTTTYYAFCKNTTTLCQSDAALPVTVTVIPKPTAPTNPLASPSTICAGDASVLSATCASGSAIWYQNSNYTSPLASTIITPIATTICYVRCEGNGCVSNLGSQVTVTVTPTPTAATSLSAAPATICAGGSSVLNATCATGTVAWYTNAGLTTALPSTTVTPTTTTTYYVRCENNGCFGPVSSQIVTVNPTPTAPTITPTATTICSGSSTDLTASGCAGTVNWFVQGNTTSGGTGNTLTVSPGTTTNYVANCMVGTCTSPLSSPSTITVVTAPVSPSISVSDNAICAGGNVTLTAQSCAGTLIWYKDGNTIGSGLTLSDTPTANAIYTATCNGNGAVSCSTPANATLNVAVNPLPIAPTLTPTAPIICSGSSTTLTATGCAAAETVNWSNGQTGSSISISLAITTSYTAKCVNTTTGCESVLSNPATVTVNQTPPTAPTGTATPTAICSGASTTLTAGTCSVGSPVWYTDAGLTTTVPSTTVSPTTTTSYFVACVNNGCKGPSEEVIVTVTATPTQPTAVSASLPTICSGGSSTLTANCSVGTPIWYTNIGLTTTLASTTVSPTTTTTYAVICNNNGCKSTASTQIITVNQTPLSPTGVAASPPAVCSGVSSTLSASCSIGSPVWYSNSDLTTPLASTTVTPAITTIYYVRCENNGCFGPSEPITVTVTATPNSPATAAAIPNPLCLGSNAVLSATCSTGTLKWYSDAALTTVQAATTVSPTANTNYYAVCDLNGCVSTPSIVNLVVKNCAKTDTVTVTPSCPTCPTLPICATGDDLPSTGTVTYQNCGLTTTQNTQGTLTTDANGCIIWKPNGMQTDTIKTCVKNV